MTVSDRQSDTNEMPCSICREPGHNKRTCPNTDDGMEDCEYCGYTHHYEDKCPNEATACHYKKWREDEEEEESDDDETVSVVSDDDDRHTKVATTGKYAGMTAVQIEAIFAERERKNYEELVAPIVSSAKKDEEENDVDARDAPNIYPYKKCSDCGERKSCGNYKENDWFCEDCGVC